MANILFKKSYLHKTFDKVPYESLWNTKGAFTTIRLIDSPPKFLFLKEHLINLNKSLKKLNIDFAINSKNFKILVKDEFKKNVKYNHLLRIAVNSKKISIDLRKRLKTNRFFKGIRSQSRFSRQCPPHCSQFKMGTRSNGKKCKCFFRR